MVGFKLMDRSANGIEQSRTASGPVRFTRKKWHLCRLLSKGMMVDHLIKQAQANGKRLLGKLFFQTPDLRDLFVEAIDRARDAIGHRSAAVEDDVVKGFLCFHKTLHLDESSAMG